MHNHPGEFRRKNAAARLDDAVELNEVVAALKSRDAEIKQFSEKATAEIKATGAMATETKAALEKLAEAGTETQDRLQALEQKMARRAMGGSDQKSLGEQFTELPGFKSMQDSREGTVRLNVKANTITSATTDAAGSVGAGIVADRRPGVIELPQRDLTIRQLLLPGTTSSNAIEFVREKGFNNNAAPVAENPGQAKPQSDIQFELLTTPVRTIAHWFAASKQVLTDIPMLQSYINGKALIGLGLEEEDQILVGDGIGQNLHGLIPQASTFKETLYSDAADTMIDTIRRAALQVRVAQYRPTFVVLNPVDWAAIELTKDDEKRYIEVSIRSGGEMRLWRLNVIETTAIAQGQFLVGATMGAQVFDREEAAVQISTSHSDFFTKNLIAILAEERLALAVTRPESFVHGYFELFESPPLND
jgi:HK97 family phage major capsid protein